MVKLSHVYSIIFILSVYGFSYSDTRYVRTPETCTNTVLQFPYTSWDNAATQIQWAVTAASVSETVLVSNGTYTLTAQLSFDTASVTLQSVNGRDFTFINGNYSNTTNRCLLIGATEVVIDGFTITNGFASSNVSSVYPGGGGAIRITGSKAVIKNCTISKNQAHMDKSGWTYGGGGIMCMANNTVSNCIISFNTALSGAGGGIAASGGYFVNCDIISNIVVASSGGGVSGSSTLINCRIIGNQVYATDWGGYGGGVSWSGAIRNCLVKGNSASNSWGGGIGFVGASGSEVSGCTIVDNIGNGGGLAMLGKNGKIYDTIVRNNSTKGGSVSDVSSVDSTFSNNYLYNCCTSSTNTFGNNFYYSSITKDPKFIDRSSGNYRLSGNSPCINTGTNQDWMTNSVDLDGRMRIRYGTVDMGAYERIYEGSVYSVR